jgi:AAA+ superfamily predicted ATPase
MDTMVKQTQSQRVAQNVTALLRARNPLLWVVTREEARVEKYLFEAAAAAKFETRFWDIAAGITGLDGTVLSDAGQGDPDAALDAIRSNAERTVWIMRDLPVWLTPPVGAVTLRRLRNLARELPSKATGQVIIVISPIADVPAELANHATVIEWPLPDREEIAALLDATVSSLPQDMQATGVNGARDAAIDAAVGLSGEEAQATFARSLVQLRRIDPATIAAEKERAIRSSGLEWLKPVAGGMKAVGGLDVWKQWAVSRAIARTPAARAYGLQAPKGVVLLGVPGCGKTLSASALAGEWGVPFIKLDMGAQKSKYVGDSEAKLRNSFNTIDAIGPCVLLVDEIEKALAGASGDAGDGGVSADALGALLAWMNDRTSEAFVVATCNSVDKLPPELLRKGRFDEVWWIGLPNREERTGIITAALTKRGRDAVALGIDIDAIAEATEQFSGAEIDALVPDAMFAAFAENAREITTLDILTAAKSVKPAGTEKKRPDFAREATTSSQVTVTANAGRVLDF